MNLYKIDYIINERIKLIIYQYYNKIIIFKYL